MKVVTFEVRFCYLCDVEERERAEDSMADCPFCFWEKRLHVYDPDECSEFQAHCCLNPDVATRKCGIPERCPLHFGSWTVKLKEGS